MDAGFKSQSNFYAAFKEVTGMSPGDYRKANC
jgi:AraC-like DNA-binding protein